MLKAVLFDHDGTLVNSEGLHYQHWQSVMASHGVILSEPTYNTELAGLPTPENARWLVNAFDLDEDISVISQKKHDTTKAFLEDQAFPLMQDAKQVIGFFREAGLKTGIVTGARRIGVMSTIDTYDLYSSIDVVITAEDVRNGKPAPDCYLLALERLKIKPQECFAIEDTGPGVAAAAAAGLTCCAVPNEYSAHHDFSSAVRTFLSLSEVMEWAKEAYDLNGLVC